MTDLEKQIFVLIANVFRRSIQHTRLFSIFSSFVLLFPHLSHRKTDTKTERTYPSLPSKDNLNYSSSIEMILVVSIIVIIFSTKCFLFVYMYLLKCKANKLHVFENIDADLSCILFNTFPNKPCFLHVCSTSLLKTLREKKKLLVTSNFSFFPQCFLPVWITFCHFRQIGNCRLQTLSVWKTLKFVVWERVKEANLLELNSFCQKDKTEAGIISIF